MARETAPHSLIELADYCMSVTRDIMRGRDAPLKGDGNTDAVEAMLAITAAIDNGRIPEPTGWQELRGRINAMYARLLEGRTDIGAE
ncbi:hypothetical protein [Indioceanicola profundi]|uniref:hypothetical protein n=1 Tax=Indioceanicola profundi TaxID=2220096 RepID=UPI000E6ACD80|nr:hypothetical protein [Indioceanicola profundi]